MFIFGKWAPIFFTLVSTCTPFFIHKKEDTDTVILTHVAGKVKEYTIGTSLRERYDAFLGDVYYPKIVDARSTDTNRTKMSLELVLAGLFPPRTTQIWNPMNLTWQPIPYNYLPSSQDKELQGHLCPKYLEEYNRIISSDKFKAEFNKYSDTVVYLNKNTGLNLTSFHDVYNLYFVLTTEEEFGLKLPKWTESVYPDLVREMAIREYLTGSGTDNSKRLGTGYLIKKIIEDTQNRIKDLENKRGRKIYLYSAHESNIARLLLFLDIFQPLHVPNYGSYIIFEIHKKDDEYGVKVFYQDYLSESLNLVRLPACQDLCPLDKFIKLYQDLIPDDDSECG
ncbi:unnamed protein product [Acanthoscelides obtectus]|uniref:acid phosphatase n=1 Tax=Acanthoscelides obtectus TaxID=200917 RepID=A0A9P0JQI7_ACAOB|nr:unnamed protein product [Acanthoscelides obtectus]CAK1661750.1 hypothetical protein AOBTE_LOCUS22772 [Acanthoscelides obtectus]